MDIASLGTSVQNTMFVRVPIHRPRVRSRKRASWLLCSGFTFYFNFYSYFICTGE